MPKCIICGSTGHVMSCICNVCLGGKTNGGRIMSHGFSGLADFILEVYNTGELPSYCQNLDICKETMETGQDIPLSRCRECVMAWLNAPEGEAPKHET